MAILPQGLGKMAILFFFTNLKKNVQNESLKKIKKILLNTKQHYILIRRKIQ
jgi:hypothetical protein